MTAPGKPIPELAGIATYEQAARIGYSVEENVERLLRLHWTERRLMDAMLAQNLMPPGTKADDVVDNHFAEAAVERLGTYR